MKLKFIAFLLLFFVCPLQAQTLDDYLWPRADKPSIFFASLVEYVNLNCKSYKRFPTTDIESMCQLQKILDQRASILNKISKSKILLPPGREWEALFLGVASKDYDFSGNEITYNDVSDFLIHQIALKKTLEAINRVFLVWHPDSYFSQVVYPAHISSIEGSSLFIYQLRYVKESKCQEVRTHCVPFYKDLNADLLGHLKALGQSAINEISASSSWNGIESYLLTRTSFRKYLHEIYADLKDVSVTDLVMIPVTNPNAIVAQKKITRKLEDLNKYDLSLNEVTVNAIFALAQLTEMVEILNEMNIAAHELSADKITLPVNQKYIAPVDAMVSDIKSFMMGL